MINRITKIFSWGIMGISVIFAIVYFYRLSGTETAAQLDIAAPYIMWAYILVGIAVVFSLLFPLVNIILNPRNAYKVLIGVAGVGLVFLLGYLLADPTPIVGTIDNPDFSKRWVLLLADTGIYATYILFAVAIISLLYVNIKGLFLK